MSATIEKPPYGTPCNRCGLCCERDLCPLARIMFGNVAAPCPALERDEAGGAVCGVIAHPALYAPGREPAVVRDVAAEAIGAGIGCDARVEGDIDPPKSYRWQLRKAAARAKAVKRRVTTIFGWRTP